MNEETIIVSLPFVLVLLFMLLVFGVFYLLYRLVMLWVKRRCVR